MSRKNKDKDKPPLWTRAWFIILGSLFLAGVFIVALVFAFPKQTLGSAAKFLADGPAPNTQQILEGDMPSTSALRDKDGNVITHFYDQRRQTVTSENISTNMKNAIVSIEDRRFYEHDGVDWQGVIRAVVTNATTDDVQGASTLTQQYIKNYTWLITAGDEQEQSSAIEQTYTRKIAEIATAEDITELLSKDEILTRYLNLVSFGQGSYGIEDASRTYFGVPARDLTIPQSAMLAGVVQAPTAFDPYANYEGAKKRRNLVLDAMARDGHITPEEATNYKSSELGILESPHHLSKGCASAGNRGFFCDQAIKDLESRGITVDMLNQGGYDVATTLDPKAQDVATDKAKKNAPDARQPVAEAVALVEPGQNTRYVRALATSRDYGYSEGQSSLPLASSLVGNGAGSVFKIFAAAVALESGGLGLQTPLPVPPTYQATGLGAGGNEGCPPDKYCVSNVGTYPPTLTLTQSLALSPNTPFIQLAESLGNADIVNKAVKMGLRSYDQGEEGSTIADRMRASGSFVLGPTEVNTLELANVGATIASGGMWCEPMTIAGYTLNGEPQGWDGPACERALESSAATQLAHGLAQDSSTGTAANAARDTGWGDRPVAAKTGTTDASQSASFLGFTKGLAGAVYAFNDGDKITPLCSSPLRQCGDGNLFGGLEPARTWFDTFLPLIDSYGGAELPQIDKKDLDSRGEGFTRIRDLAVGKPERQAIAALENKNYDVTAVTHVDNRDVPRGTVVDVIVEHSTGNGGRVKLVVSNTGSELNVEERNLPSPATPQRTAPPTPRSSPQGNGNSQRYSPRRTPTPVTPRARAASQEIVTTR